MKTVRWLVLCTYLFLSNTCITFSQPSYANDGLNIVAILVAQTLLQVMFPSLPEEMQIQMQISSPEVFQSVIGGQHIIIQSLVDTPSMQQDINDPVEVLEFALTRVQSKIDAGQIIFQEVYPNSDIEALQQELHCTVSTILQSGISTYPAHEQEGVAQVMKEKINAFMIFLRSKISTD